MTPYFVTLTEAIEKFKRRKGEAYASLIEDGDMSVKYFEPKGAGIQKPHTRDGLYFIARGRAGFNRNGEMLPCKSGDVFFVPAGLPHRFEKFSDDFATWIVLYGPERL